MSLWKRRLLITCDSYAGHQVQVRDLETDRIVAGVAQIRIDIRPTEHATAHLLMYQLDENEQFIIKNGEPVTETRSIQDVSIDLLAMEPFKRSEIEEMFKDALFVKGAHHKQYYLWRIAHALGLSLDFDEDEDMPERGIAP